jgi:hypothetical protein
MGEGEGALEVDVDDRVPVLLGEVRDGRIAQDPGIVDDCVESTARRDGALDEVGHGTPVAGRSRPDHRLPPSGDDGVDDLLRRILIHTLSPKGDTEIVHHHGGAVRRKFEAVAAAQAAPPAGHDDDAVIEQSLVCHAGLLRWIHEGDAARVGIT